VRGGDAALSQTTVTICFTAYYSYRPFPAFFSLRVPQYSAPRLSRTVTGGLVEAHFDTMAGDKFHVSHAAERRI